MSEEVNDYYKEMVVKSGNEITRLDKRINFYSILRVLTLAVGAYLIYNTVQAEMIWMMYLSIFAVIIVFARWVNIQSKLAAQKQFLLALREVNQNEIGSKTDKSNIYDDGEEWENDDHRYTSDLDIFGKASLYNLLNRCATSFGRTQMATWLKTSAPIPVINERQQAAKELSGKKDWKMHFQASLLFAKADEGKWEIPGLFNYLDTDTETYKPWIKTYIKTAPWLFYGSAVVAYFFAPFLGLMFVTGLANIFLVLSFQSRVNKAERMTGRVGKTLAHYSKAFKMIETESWESSLCVSLSERLASAGAANNSISHQVKKLSEILGRLEYRLNMFVGPLLNISLAWDVKQYVAIQDWKSGNKAYLKDAFESIGSFECLVSIAGLHINYPEWCFPVVRDDKQYTLIAESIGHPLIPESLRVVNDFSLVDDLKIDIITGSNMAGKSTFLRTLGINAVLALCGAPVCAAKMELTDMRIFTYMRIKDSLNENISTFKAELIRLQFLLDELKSGEKVYFLIDEMLRGTNSVDKYLGSKAIIEKLISQNSVGIVATHDLQIAHLEEDYPAYIRNFYFDIEVVDEEMKFDYKLKNGACKTFNASLLLKKLGIEVNKEL